ncbi:low molecular weight phosphatase family protein [Microvirga tunisiensis]|uniref:Low molecular weight phosphatase family protein n=2 Tax=Pannonibacter tanglangensis TaxID=2750084 RepID=A0A7X5F5J4_9HYPH|nr:MULTISPECIES: low molecular weight phosphatase family protein [unclassified Pannonibacter]NBN65675.1 low molecular weight phosphatase family protein [Pannonibacter sp. XCT-34]NBN80098.1 low molecular weight phosphatase family protein [Pannonibacter sp. XCT-53]
MRTATVLFVCPDNALLGPLAEAYLNAIGGNRIRAFSAGPAPTESLHPAALRLLSDHGLAHGGLMPKSWDIFLLPHAPQPDRVVALTTSVASAQPHWRGSPRQTLWEITSGALTASPAACAEYFRRIRQCIDRIVQDPALPGDALLRRA